MPFGSSKRPSGQKFQETQIFPYSREQVFDLVADIDRYSEFVPMCTESKIFRGTRRVEQINSNQAGQDPAVIDRHVVQAELAVGYPPFRERYTSDVVLERPWRIVATAVPGGGIFTHMRTIWVFAKADSSAGLPTSPFIQAAGSSTRVSFSIEYEFASPLHAQAASLVFDTMAQKNMAAYLARCHLLYGKSAKR
ncbi:Coenzyme Q-binding protein coq10a, mitochondrial [Coemansia brasiliensis]|uniref:Coenzyme Q-binding protein coq10a, mitochondrial n=1 Tax=Coemansia brasiliensis TaxID=2650707 RepID=A0A9W8IBK8_9FUNG|nr:Coenzyme Q-binding protein coq10a, mitochondrial [Coemansia brasiliensis]